MDLDPNTIFDHQIDEVQESFTLLLHFYSILLRKRLNNELNRDEYMMYDLMDMMIGLKSAYQEVISDHVDSSYMVEKLQNVYNHLIPVLEHFKAKAGDK